MPGPDDVPPPGVLARLRDVELFADLDADGLRWVAGAGSVVRLDDRAVLFEDGQPGDRFYVLLGGELLITKVVEGREEVFGRHRARPERDESDPDGKPRAAHQFTGELPMLAGGGYVAKAVAVGETTLLAYDRDGFYEILARFPRVCQVLLPVLAWRIHSYEERAGRRTMLEGLGTLAAGLAHELNNPTAALMRTAGILREAVSDLVHRAADWAKAATPAERVLLGGVIARFGGTPVVDALAAADAADLAEEWLAERGVDADPELATTLADHGVGLAVLAEVAEGVRAAALPAALHWLCLSLHVDALVNDITEAGGRIESLVSSTKTYSNLNRAPQQDVDVVKGIEATVAMQAAKLRRVRVRREYAEVPPVRGYPSELNQVWTNLIDNAVDAMGGVGELWLAARREAEDVVVEVRDNGPGVPQDVLPWLFQPFFTTKDIGKGTGLGLHVCRDVVTQRHSGTIEVTSVPGDTRFTVRLPAVRGC
ncbi:ATP-binding protein [Actinokineospora auranticolor]|uniref:sensor histidine kinase n=1 Tax=Actinokineospora auranticolor TaxID=155976 RepID=UPI0015E2BEB9|nr:ATP-binding protein [Actinokineospora auranticolor]